jgi:glycosyltransferase involved in cell wall biosynthesis
MPSSKLRVLVVAHNAVAASNRRRVDALAELPELEVCLLTPPWWEEEGRRVDVVQPDSTYEWQVGRTLATNNGTRYIFLNHLLGLIQRFHPDVIDLHEEPFSLVALQVLFARRLLASRAALVFYSAVNVERRWRQPYRWIEQLVLRSADGAYVPNGDVPKILAGKGMRGSASVVPLGVDLARFERARAFPLFDYLEGAPRPYVGFLGRLEPVKGLDVLIDAVPELSRRVTLVIAGDGSERERLERLVWVRNLSSQVRFMGPIAFDDVPSFLNALDVLVLPSVTLLPLHREQFGRVLAEAMAARVPVVGSSSGAIPEVIGDAGLVVPEGDPVALAEAIDSLTLNEPFRRDLARSGHRRAAERFGWPVVVRETVEQVYRPALAHRRGESWTVAASDREQSVA